MRRYTMAKPIRVLSLTSTPLTMCWLMFRYGLVKIVSLCLVLAAGSGGWAADLRPLKECWDRDKTTIEKIVTSLVAP